MWSPALTFERVAPYLAAVERVARAQGEDLAILVALGSVETEWGWGAGYRPKGSPDGTGDWTARRGRWLDAPGVQVIRDVRALPLPWAPQRDEAGSIRPGPYAIPGDGLGWGRGLLQLDYCGAFRHLLQPAPWPIERQVEAACRHLAATREVLTADHRGHPDLERANLAAYNAGAGAVLAALRAGADPDSRTKTGRYGAQVLERAAALRAAYPCQLAGVPQRFPTGRITT